MKKIIPALVPALVLVFAGLGQTAVAADAAVAKPAPKAAKPAAVKPAAKAAGKTAAKSTAAPTDTLPADVLKEMGELVEKAVQPASAPLQASEDFQPYGVLMRQDGSLQIVRWTQPNPPPPMELLKKIFRAVMIEGNKPEFIAAATVAPSSVPTSDPKVRVKGIRAEVDHRRGEPRVVFVPYTHENGKLVLGTTIYLPGVNAVYDHSKAPVAAPGAAAPAAVPAAAASTPAKP